MSPGPGDTWTETTLHDFNPAIGDGAEPFLAGVIFDASGNLYGTTTTNENGDCQFDQYRGCGTVFELSPNPDGTWAESIIFKFDSRQPHPESSLIFDDVGRMYGTTLGEYGCSPSCGSVFRLTPQEGGTWKATALLLSRTNGAMPLAALVLKGDALYGTTNAGGSSGSGVVFEIEAGVETVLHSFMGQPNDGAFPAFGGPLLARQGKLYGATQGGGLLNQGTIFQLIP